MKILDVPQSGSVAGTTSSRNRYGQYRRTRAIPVNPATFVQVQQRGYLASLSAQWRTLDQSVRDAWNAYANATPVVDSLGSVVFLTGLQQFVGVNSMNLQAEVAIQTIVPDGTPVALPVAAVDETTAVGFTLTYVPATVATTSVLSFASPPTSPGVNFNGDYRLVNVSVAPDTDDVLISAANLAAKFGALAAGMKFFFRTKAIDGGNRSANYETSQVLT